jgi:hypothetical protein
MYLIKYRNLRIGFQAYFKNIIVADKLALLTVRFFLISSKTGARISLHSAMVWLGTPCDAQ